MLPVIPPPDHLNPVIPVLNSDPQSCQSPTAPTTRPGPMPMDEERSVPTICPEPPDDGPPDSLSPADTTPAVSTTDTDSSASPTPTPCLDTDVANLTYTEPLILRSKVTPKGSLGDEGDNGNNNNSLSHPDFALPSTSITCQPAARSTPLHPAQPCRTQPAGQPRSGTKPHKHTHSSASSASQPHCQHHSHQHHPPYTHTRQGNGAGRGGGGGGGSHDRPKLGSLPRGGSSTSSSSSGGPRHTKRLQSDPSIASHSSKRSKGSSNGNSSQIPTEAQDDCCVHCILACLFCEFLTLCNIVLNCATCGSCSGDDSCFCCCCASEECGDCELPCDMDCGIIDACCESADCLEICMECCGLCFSS
ncbi:unnamed protein product [Gadus morhua 'NCC']